VVTTGTGLVETTATIGTLVATWASNLLPEMASAVVVSVALAVVALAASVVAIGADSA